MIKSVQFTNYRNLRFHNGEQMLTPLTILVGANGSGKTNLLRVFKFLQETLNASDASFRNALYHFGGDSILDKSVPFPSSVEFHLRFRLVSGYTHLYSLGLGVQDNNSVVVQSEQLVKWHPKSPLNYYRPVIGKPAYYQVYTTEFSGDSPYFEVGPLPLTDLPMHLLPSKILKDAPVLASSIPFFEAKEQIKNFVRRWHLFSSSQMLIDAIKNSTDQIGQQDRYLNKLGANLALVFHNLVQESIDFEERMNDAMKQLFPNSRRLRAITVGRIALTLEWYVHGIEKPFYLDDMSDGTIRMLCWAVILCSPQLPTLIVIDEPEANIHPAWLRVLAGWIRDASRRTQVIVSTHSPDLLDYFTEDLESVRVFDKDMEAPNYYTLRAIDREAIADKLAEGWELGDLYRVGDPNVGGWPW